MRASQRPGASISAGVGRVSADSQSRSRRLEPGPLDDAGDERGAAVVVLLGELEAEEALDEAVGVGGLDPAAPHGFGDHAVAADEAAADAVHHVVDVAVDDHDERVDAGQQGLAGPATGMAPSSTSGSDRNCWNPCMLVDAADLHVGEPPLERVGVGLEAGGERRASGPRAPGPHVGQAEHGVVGELVEADPEPEVVGVEAPVGAEGVEVAGTSTSSPSSARGIGRSYRPKLRRAR